jgi:spore germination protein GerM
MSALAAATALGACSGDDGGTATTDSTTTPSTSTASTTTTALPRAGRTVAVYFLRNEKVSPVKRTIDVDDGAGGGADTIEAVLGSLFAGPSADEQAAGFVSQVPPGTELRGVSVADGVVTVDVSSAFASGGGSASMLGRVAQVVFSATQSAEQSADGQRVRFRIDGQDVTAIGGEGVVVDPPVSRADFEDQQPIVLVESPLYGAEVPPSFTASGTSNAFEAGHVLQVLGPDGAVLFDTPVTATSGTGTRGTWQTTVALPASTTGPVTLRVFEPSARDGSPLGLVDIALTVR